MTPHATRGPKGAQRVATDTPPKPRRTSVESPFGLSGSKMGKLSTTGETGGKADITRYNRRSGRHHELRVATTEERTRL